MSACTSSFNCSDRDACRDRAQGKVDAELLRQARCYNNISDHKLGITRNLIEAQTRTTLPLALNRN